MEAVMDRRGAVLPALLALMAVARGRRQGTGGLGASGENIALGKSYTLAPRPNLRALPG